MTHKVLLADDSLTIQKVIKITLANEPYTLLDCRSEADLMGFIDRESPQLVLLDFSLSETHSGYELCKIIRSKKPQTAVLMMYGTFDSVDENALKNCGAKGKIIKPFDSTKFINLCRSLLEEVEGTTQESTMGAKIDEVFSPRQSEEVSWKVDAPTPKTAQAFEPEQTSKQELESLLNPLESNMQEWGMNIPGKIGQSSSFSVNIPPKIESTPIKMDKIEEASALPMSSDLEYPDMGEIQSKINSAPVKIEVEVSAPKSKLIPLTELAPASSKELSFEESTGSFEISLEDGTTSDEDIRKLEEQISDEISHTVAKNTNTEALKNFADLWAADEIEGLNPTMNQNMEKASLKHSHIELEPMISSEKLSSHPDMIKEVKKNIVDFNLDSDLEEKIKEAITPIVERLVKDYCKQTLEKVAWEVIPDLAENLIRKELQRISDSVIGE